MSGQLPTTVNFRASQFKDNRPTLLNQTLSGKKQVRQIGSQYFSFTVQMPLMKQELAQSYFAFLQKQKGSFEDFTISAPLDNLGAGFSLASYDMDIRGSGNLLGDEQSGQIKEVGVELYQDMLKEAVSSYKDSSKKIEELWSPSISLGLSILIPEDYVLDLPTRMSLYRKAGELSSPEDINTFSEELFDRFGPPPEEVNNLLMTLMIKNKCLYNKINLIDAGPKGVLLGFKNNFFNNADKLLEWVTKKSGQVKIRPDQKLFLQKTLNTREEKFNAVLSLIEELQLLNN